MAGIHLSKAADVSRELAAIREGLDLLPADFAPKRYSVIDQVLRGEELHALFHPSGLLIRSGLPVFAYIRDHTEKSLSQWGGASSMKKVHFTVCAALNGMKAKGYFERYRVTNATTDEYDVDCTDGAFEVALCPCQFCLGNVGYQDFDYNMDRGRKQRIVRDFRTSEAMPLLLDIFDVFRRDTSGLKSAGTATGYPKTWPKISATCKERRGYRCEQCGVVLKQDRSLLETHHVNGDKHNNTDRNLRCLCKECHSHQHSHHKVEQAELQRLRRIRSEQRLRVR